MTFGKLTLDDKDYILQMSEPYYLGTINTFRNFAELRIAITTKKPFIFCEITGKLTYIEIVGTIKNRTIQVSAEGLSNLNAIVSEMAKYYEKLNLS